MQQGARYWAFISYSHYDRQWARWLHRKLETYRVPRRLVGAAGADGARPRRLNPIFRDRDELPSSADLGGIVNRALRDSRYLIVICSRHSAASRWVNQEVETFKKLGREQRILCLKVDEIEDSAACFVPALLQRYDAEGRPTGEPAEPLAADIAARADGRDGAVLKLIAGMLGVGYDELRRRERRRRIQQRVAIAAGVLALFAAAGAGWRWQQNEKQRALDEQARTVRTARLYESGREELLAHNEARAAVLLNEVYSLGVDTPALRYLLGHAMQVVDAQQLRIDTPSPPIDVGLSPDGSRAFSVGLDRVLRGYDARSGARRYEVPLGAMRSWLSAYSARGGLIWVDSHHGDAPQHRLRLYDAASGAALAQYALGENGGIVLPPVASDDAHVAFIAPDRSIVLAAPGGVQRHIEGRYSAVRFCRDTNLLLAGREDGIVELRGLADTAPRRRYGGLRERPTMLDSTAGCALLAAGTVGGAVRVWEGSSGNVLMSSGHRKSITDLMFSNDGSRLLSLSRGAAGIWNGHNGALLYASKFFGGKGNVVALRPDGHQFGQILEGRLSILDARAGLEAYTLDGHLGAPNTFHFAADTPRLLSGGADGALVVWALPDRAPVEFGSAPPEVAPAATFSADGAQLFVGDARGGGTLWQRQPLRRLGDYAQGEGVLSVAALSRDQSLLATGSYGQAVALVELPEGRVRHRYAEVGGRPTALQFDPSGRYLAADIESDGLQLWDTASGASLLRYAAGEVHASAFSPAAPLLAIGQHGVVRLYDASAGTERWTVELPIDNDNEANITVLAFSGDGQRLLVTAQRARAFILDVADGRILQRIDDPSSAYFNVGTFDAQGTQVALGDWSNSGRLWRLADNHLRTLPGHTASVDSVAFDPSGDLLLTAGQDGVVKLWDARRGELLDSFMAHDGLIPWRRARFAPDGAAIFSSGRDGVARLWPLVRERRDPATIAARLACRSAWRVADGAVVPRPIDVRTCRAADTKKAADPEGPPLEATP